MKVLRGNPSICRNRIHSCAKGHGLSTGDDALGHVEQNDIVQNDGCGILVHSNCFTTFKYDILCHIICAGASYVIIVSNYYIIVSNIIRHSRKFVTVA